MAQRILPYTQGCLDSFCGIYSVINATRLIVAMDEEESMALFGKCMQHIEGRKSLGKVSVDGISTTDVWSILKKVVSSEYEISVERPFHRAKVFSAGEYFKELREYYAEKGKKSVIFCCSGYDWSHWTVIRRITMKRIMLFDSDEMKTFNIARLDVGKRRNGNGYLINPRDTFYLYAQ